MSITVHHLNNSRSHRILWLLEELDVDYEIEFYERHPKTMLAPKKLRDLHPLGKAPVVTDGDRVLAESGAILEYLTEVHGNGRFRPEPGTDDFYEYRYWLHYAEGSAMTPLLVKLIFSQVKKNSPMLVKPIANKIADTVNERYTHPNIKTHTEFWERTLAEREWFAGEFSAADIQMSFPLEAACSRADASKLPNVMDFVKRIRQRPAYQAAVERGGPYEIG